MNAFDRSGLKLPDPAPIRGNGMDWKPCSLAIVSALRMEARIHEKVTLKYGPNKEIENMVPL
jgi:hypothetical protein